MIFSEVANDKEVHIRLLQFKPAWALHCLLRFKNLPYLCENTAANNCMGRQTPLVIDGNYFFSERLALEHLSIRNTEGLGDLCLITNNDHTSDKMMCNHIEISLLAVYEKLELLIEESNKVAYLDTRILALSIPTKIISKLKNCFKVFDISSESAKDNNYDGSDQPELLARLDTIYTQLDTILLNNSGHLIKSEKSNQNGDFRSVSDSILFGHLTEALSHKSVSLLLKKHSALIKFVQDILDIYFLAPLENSNQSLQKLLWKDALKSISENHIFGLTSDESFRKKIMAALEVPLNDSYFSGSNPLKSQSVNNSGKEIDMKEDNNQINENYIKSYRLNGPSSIMNQYSRWSSYYFSLPSTLNRLFPSLSLNFKIKSIPGNLSIEVFEISKMTDNDVEISLFGVVFITAISGVILHNILKYN